MTDSEAQHFAHALRGASDAELRAELNRRAAARAAGVCPACGRALRSQPMCDRGFEHFALEHPTKTKA